MKELKVRFFSGAISSTHTIFLKQHSVRKSSSLVPSGKSILSLGWPPYCPKESIAELFSRVGQVLSVNIRDQPGSIEEIEQSTAPTGRFHVAYVTFSSASEVFKAMQLSSSATPLPCSIGATGMSKWAAQYKLRYPDPAVVSAEVGEKIAAYDRDKEATKALLKKGVTEPDADGWITVTRKNSSKIHQSKQHDRKKHKKSLRLVNLYQFQQRETQRQHIAELRKKFNEDKVRVAVMRSQRKFKPF